MKIYTVKNDIYVTDIQLLLKLNANCARLHWSRTIKDIPSNVMNALETIEGYVESKIVDLCGKEKCILTDEEESVMLGLIRKNDKLKDTLGIGIVMKGKQAKEVSSIIKNTKGLEKLYEALETGVNIVIF